jgi:uncharacterized coiled-coil DUF342 family protein
MMTSLGRRLDQFRSKVQQQIVRADDEIGRCQDYLDSLSSEIADYEDKHRKLQIESEQRREKRFGRQLSK